MSQNASNNPAPSNITPISQGEPVPEFGGKSNAILKEFYKDAKRLLGITAPQAERLVRSFQSDWGKAEMKTDKISVGNLSSKKQAQTLREVNIAKDCATTVPLKMFKLVQELNKLTVYGMAGVTVKMDEATMAWIEKVPASKEKVA